MNAATRRERRAAERDRRRPGGTPAHGAGAGGARRAAAPRTGLAALVRSPIALVTAAAVLVGVGLLAANVLLSQPRSAASIVAPAEPAPTDLATGRTLGAADAKVTLDVYVDFQCPNCAAYAQQVEPRLVNQYVRPGSARMVIHDLAFLGPTSNPGSDESVQAALAASCAEDQGRFWSYQEYLFANQGPVENGGTFSRSLLDGIASRLGLDRTRFDACMADPARTKAVQSETQTAMAAGIDRTPTILVNGKAVGSWDLQTISNAIDAALQGNSASPSASPSASAPAG